MAAEARRVPATFSRSGYDAAMFFTYFPPEPALILAVVCLAIMWRAILRLRRTTLVAPIAWTAVAVVTLFYALYTHTLAGTYTPYTVAVMLIAPTLAVLGAKRPQNGAWQFIVLTLVGVLLMPVVQAWAFGDRTPHVHSLFRWVIVVHIFIGVVNYLPTRFAGPALLFGLTQTLAAAGFFPWDSPRWALAWALVPWCLTAAIGSAWFIARRPSRFAPGLDRLWHDFRNAYGLVWGLRIAERLNAAAAKHGWPVEFAWSGMLLREGTTELDPDVRHRIEREMRSHLRRFVSHDWIVQRLANESGD